MGSMFRSEEMALCQMFVQPEAAYSSVSDLGELGLVQFRDLNDGVTLFHRKFVNEVRRCDELERKLRYIEKEMSKNDIKLEDVENQDSIKAPYPRDIIDLEARLEKTENELLELSQNEVNLAQNYLELTELQLVLENANNFFTDREVINLDVSNGNGVDEGTNQQRGRLGFVAGVIERERVFAFERMLWRISRGNVFLKRADVSQPIKDLETGNEVYKSTFVAFFQGEQLNSRIKKVCTGFHASLYPCPSNSTEREDMLKGVRVRLEDLKIVLNQTEDHRRRVLLNVKQEIPLFSIMVMKMKAIYHTMNFFNTDVTNKCLVAECWLPKSDLQTVNEVLIKCSRENGCTVESFINVIETNEAPPTFNRNSRFTQGFQNLIDSYGVSSYREANPALYTIITFPFLFAVMFGDMGHGAILSLFGIWMVATEEKHLSRKSSNEIWNIFFGGRYIIMLMGLFSVYTGFIYNDIFSLSFNIFGSKWFNMWNESTVMDHGNEYLTMDPASDTRGVYPMGLDPIWQLAPQNKIIFHNSFKMKLSIIFGICHMIFGVCMNLVNYKHFRQMINIVLEFLPKILFLVLLFGYLVFLMFFKWVKYSAQSDDITLQATCAPSVLILFIEMMMMTGEPAVDPEDPNPSPCIHTIYEGEKSVERVLVLLGLLCIPWMLLAKPLYIQFQRKKNAGKETEAHHSSGGGDHDDEPMSEIWIHQAIHTIEYVLETISHTASYLRLWALSLAHAQLSDVLYTMIMRIGLHGPQYYGGIMMFFIFGIWAFLTLGILVMMEGLSAFLHTLRLHWVEFMSKFFQGTGYAFEPFSMKQILDGTDEE